MTEKPAFENPSASGETLEETARFAPRFNDAGLIPAIATDRRTGALLMLAWMNAEALAKTIETGEAWYWSRSRGELWRKGATSGHTQKIAEIRTDCDQDAIQLIVEQTGLACHTGRPSCFYRIVERQDGRLALRFDEAGTGAGA